MSAPRRGRRGKGADPVTDEALVLQALSAQPASAPPILLWSEEAARYPFALIAPRKFAPGRERRWLSRLESACEFPSPGG